MIKNKLAGLAILLLSSYSNAGGELVSQPHQFHYWQGCYTENGGQIDVVGMYYRTVPTAYNGVELERQLGYVDPNESTNYPYDGVYSCTNYFTKTFINQNVSPIASFSILSQEPNWSGGTNRVKIASASTDSDGQIAQYEWWVNGVKHSETGPILSLTTQQGGTYTIKHKVTDDGILKRDTEYSRWLNNGQRYFELSDSVTNDVYLLPHSCNRGCILD